MTEEKRTGRRMGKKSRRGDKFKETVNTTQ